MTAKQLIDEAAQKGIKLWWEPFDKAQTRSELVAANGYLTKIANAALVERNYYIELLTNALERSEAIQSATKGRQLQGKRKMHETSGGLRFGGRGGFGSYKHYGQKRSNTWIKKALI